MLGLPVVRQAIVGGARSDHETASVIYLRNDDLRFAEYGELTSSAGVSLDDACRASCIDWYGDARPIFAKGRVFALLGYELVEGSSMGTGIAESKRVTFAPGQTSAER